MNNHCLQCDKSFTGDKCPTCGGAGVRMKGDKSEPPAKHMKQCAKSAFYMISHLREVAEEHGYAIGVHGSLVRDIDLIACPWITNASEPYILAEAIRKAAEEINGYAFMRPEERDAYFQAGSPGAKAHGRLAWTFHLGGGPYIDLSVMPLLKETDEEHVARIIRQREEQEARNAASE